MKQGAWLRALLITLRLKDAALLRDVILSTPLKDVRDPSQSDNILAGLECRAHLCTSLTFTHGVCQSIQVWCKQSACPSISRAADV